MHTCSIHVNTENPLLCKPGGISGLSCLAAKLCTEGFRANPTTPRRPGSCSRASPGLPHPEMSSQGHCVGSAPPGPGCSRWSAAVSDSELSYSHCLRAGRLLGESPGAAAMQAIMLWANCLVLVSFSSASIRLVNVQQNFFLYFRGNHFATSTFA